MKTPKAFFYKYHKILGIIFFIPLLLTAVSGVLAVIFEEVFKNKELAHLMIEIHTMRIWGIEDAYCVILGMGMIWILITGIMLNKILVIKPKNKE